MRASGVREFFRRQSALFVSGERPGRRKGLGTEFHGFKAFEYGDDARRIDWTATLRTGVLTKAELLVRTYAEEVGVPAYLILDSTGSMGYSEAKRSLSAYTASAIAYSALYNSDRLMLVTFSGSGDGIRTTKMRRGRQHFHRVLREICLTQRVGDHRMRDLERRLRALVKKRGLMYFVTDGFFELADFARIIRLFSRLGFHVGVALVCEAWELDPPPMGFVVLRDPESEETISLDTSSSSVRELFDQIRRRREDIARDLGKFGARFFEVKEEADAMKVVSHYAESRILVKP